MDPDLNLHLRETAIDQTWLVRKPSRDGIVTAVECFDAHGELIVQFFGKRKPGQPELESWRDITAGLSRA
jgi:putative hemin transport protein